ncbi:MAG: hypothetical protein U0840_31160 [Gemmataceae bacterium]
MSDPVRGVESVGDVVEQPLVEVDYGHRDASYSGDGSHRLTSEDAGLNEVSNIAAGLMEFERGPQMRMVRVCLPVAIGPGA